MNTKVTRLATDIAFELREKGRSKRIPNPNSPNLLDGKIVRNEDRSPVKVLGMYKDVKAIGWYMETYNRAQISINFNNYKIIQKGSSIKYCYIAEGKADLYIRFGSTSEWDIAAGDIILTEAGGNLKTIDNKKIFYNKKESVINPHFIASCNMKL